MLSPFICLKFVQWHGTIGFPVFTRNMMTAFAMQSKAKQQNLSKTRGFNLCLYKARDKWRVRCCPMLYITQ